MGTENLDSPHAAPKHYSGWQVAFFVLLTVIVSVGITGIVVYRTLFPSEFTPVRLSANEQQQLESKLQRLECLPSATGQRSSVRTQPLEPEPYSEAGASREISFTERELNSLLVNNPTMAQRFAIDLSANMASAQLLVPLDPDFPLFGGQTIRLNAGLELAYENARPIVVLRGVSVWGVPIPSAWLGGLKNVDLVQEFGGGQGFWRAFADGVESIEVQEGELHIVLKE